MADYERTMTIEAPPEEVFAFVSDVSNLPHYLPPIREAELRGPSEAGAPGEKVWTRGEIPDRGTIEGEGYLNVEESRRHMQWGAEYGRDYSGWLSVAETKGGQSSEVTVHLSFGERSAEGEIQEESDRESDPLEEGIDNVLESIRRQIEEGRGKVPPSPS